MAEEDSPLDPVGCSIETFTGVACRCFNGCFDEETAVEPTVDMDAMDDDDDVRLTPLLLKELLPALDVSRLEPLLRLWSTMGALPTALGATSCRLLMLS
jgi:hypothetical protein